MIIRIHRVGKLEPATVFTKDEGTYTVAEHSNHD
jgi:hypothetical protein